MTKCLIVLKNNKIYPISRHESEGKHSSDTPPTLFISVGREHNSANKGKKNEGLYIFSLALYQVLT
jgi:hypothetical protein